MKHYLIENLDPYIRWAGKTKYIPGGNCVLRKIYDHELIYIIKGKGNFTIDSHCYDVKENDLVLIHPTVVHFVKTSYSEPYEFLGVHFDFFKQTDSENFIYSVVDGKNIHKRQFRATPIFKENIKIISKFYIPNSLKVKELLETIISEFEEKKIYYKTICNTYLKELLILLFRISKNKTIKNGKARSNVIHLINYINQHFNIKLNRTILAKIVGLNPIYLTTVFKKYTGLPLMKYVNKIRIYNSKKLMSSTSFNISEIAFKVGFQDIHYFSLMFKKMEGLTPSQFMQLSKTK